MSDRYDLYAPCMASGCSKKSSSYWYHGDGCGGKIQLRDDAYFCCPRCYTSEIIFDWNFSCAGHGYTYEPTSKQGVINALSVLASQMGPT